jgi:hypothetical protein
MSFWSEDYTLPSPRRRGGGWQKLTEIHKTDLNELMVQQDFEKVRRAWRSAQWLFNHSWVTQNYNIVVEL